MKPNALSAQATMLLLAGSVALMMTGYGIVLPVFGRRLSELGGGVEVLGLMTMAFALGQFLLAPLMGNLADRIGRRPLVLLALSAVVAANLGYLAVSSIWAYVALRFVQGALTAGLLPAAVSVIGDLFPDRERAQRVGLVMGAYSMGFIFGPTLGGLLYDSLGFGAPFLASAGMGAAAFALAFARLPETRGASPANVERANVQDHTPMTRFPLLLAGLLALDFAAIFGFAFVEPQLVFHFYDTLGVSTTAFGLLVGGYGLAQMLGQLTLARLSDRFGRRPLVVLGFTLNIMFYTGLVLFDQYPLLVLAAVMAGLGNALLTPALGAAYLDIATAARRSQVMGLKESAAALGGIAGPLLVAGVASVLGPYGVFTSAAVVTGLAAILAALALPGSRPAEPHLAPQPSTAGAD